MPQADPQPPGQSDSVPLRAWRFLPLAFIVVGLALAWAMGWHHYLSLAWLSESSDALQAHVDANYAVAAVLFVGFYVLAAALSFPAAAILTIVSGFLFGWLPGAVFAMLGASVGATLLFLAARTAFGGFLRERVGGFAARLADGFARDAFSYLLVLRLAPFIPFFVVNIAPALFNVRLRTFVLATVIGILPGALAYSWLGCGLDSVLLAARQAGRDASIHDLVTPELTAALAGLALVALLAVVVRRRTVSRGS
jgi:uncharacterized membrane protein YdjX (TVP38/TMEM64 family)